MHSVDICVMAADGPPNPQETTAFSHAVKAADVVQNMHSVMSQSAAQTTGTRIAEIRASLGLSQEEFAAQFDVGYRTLQDYEKDKGEPKVGLVRQLAALGVDPTWLLTGKRPNTVPAAGQADDFALVPRFDVTVSAGGGRWPDRENVKDYMAFRRDWLRGLGVTPDRLACLTAAGDSMAPTISDGDTILVDLAVTRLQDDAIYVLQLDGLLRIKRLQRLLHGAQVVSDNPTWPPATLGAADLAELRIVGRVRWIGRTV